MLVNHPAVLKILRVVNLLRVLFLVRRGPLGGSARIAKGTAAARGRESREGFGRGERPPPPHFRPLKTVTSLNKEARFLNIHFS